MERITPNLAIATNTTYRDEYNRYTQLTEQELAYFRATAAKALAATGLDILIEPYDHDRLPGHEEALGCYYWNDEGEAFITIDNYFIHERYRTEVEGWYAIETETLLGCICHELAHARYHTHTKYHAALTARYISMVA